MTGWHHGPMTGFDIESTGINLETDRVVTITVARIAGRDQAHEVTVQSGLIAVDVDIPAAATEVHGITTEHARANGKPAAEVLDAAANALALSLAHGTPVVGMNLSFDWTLLDRECRRWGVPTVEDRLDGSPNGPAIAPVIDVYVIDKQLDRYRKGSRKLTDLCGHYNVRIDGAHDATFDALAAARVAYRMGQRGQMDRQVLLDLYADRRYPGDLVKAWIAFGRMDLTDLHVAQREWYREQSESLGQYWRREANQLRHEAELVRADGDEAKAEALEADAAELDARVASLSPHWPVKPLEAVASC